MEVLPTTHTNSAVKTGKYCKVKKLQCIDKDVSSAMMFKIINRGAFEASLSNLRLSKCAYYQIIYVCNTLLDNFYNFLTS